MICCHLLVISLFVWNLLYVYVQGVERNCSLEELFSCLEGETCKQTVVNESSGFCTCLKNYTRTKPDGPCLLNNIDANDSKSEFGTGGVSASAIAAGLLVPVISLAIIAALVIVARRYKWFHRIRDQAHQLSVSNYDTVLVGRNDDSVG